MPGNTDPFFTTAPTLDMALISVANTARDGTGTLAAVATGTAVGKRIDRVVVKATGTTTAGMIRLFIDDGATHIRLIHEIAVSAVTPSGTLPSFKDEWIRTDFLPVIELPLNYVLRVGTHNAESFVIAAIGAPYDA